MDLSRIDDEFGEALRIARQAKGVTQEELSAMLEPMGVKLSQATIGKIERGDRKVTIGESHALARALRLYGDELVRGVSATTSLALRRKLAEFRDEAKDALHAFEAAQALVEVQASALELADQSDLRADVDETIEHLVEEYRRDRQADNVAIDLRQDLDGNKLSASKRDPRRGLRHPRATARILDLPEHRG